MDYREQLLKNQRTYMGLQNLGNTCYMNSLLQTLFMTPQFREALFKWQYQDAVHPGQEDCIPLQLQMLFARMQLLSKELKTTEPRKLIKSFQWEASEQYQQHDVQEFCRVLFDAIQQSCTTQEDFLSKLYESQSESYVKCKKCNTESVRSDRFMDLSLTVKSDFDNVYNESLEKAIKHYLTPEHLTAPNLYMCENCQSKQEAVKGLRFGDLSDILTIQLNRFELDVETFQRKKVNNRVSYPFVLDMNNFMKPYDQIVVSDDTEFLLEREKLMQTQEQDKVPKIRVVEGEFDDPLRRKKRGLRTNSPDEKTTTEKEEAPVSNVKDDISQPPAKRQNVLELSQSERSQVRLEEKAELKRSNQQLNQKFEKLKLPQEEYIEQDQTKKKVSFTTTTGPNVARTADEAYELDNDMLFGNWDKFDNPALFESFPLEQTKKPQNAPIEMTNISLPDDDEIVKDLEEESHHSQLQEQINQLLANGPNVYELYSIMIHSGGALGGHYYSYIKSFENNRWYCFNDGSVSRISWKAVQTMFGDKAPKYNSGVSAYFLMYRRASQPLNTQLPLIPTALNDVLEKEQREERERIEKAEAARREKAMELNLRVFYKEADLQIKCKKTDTLASLTEQAIASLKVEEKPENVRLRFYSFTDGNMLETFRGQENEQLQNLRFTDFKNIIIETKADHEVFSDYDPHLLMLKINIWRENINYLDEQNLKPGKIYIKDDQKLPQLLEMIAQKYNLNVEKLILQKRNPLGQRNTSEILNVDKSKLTQSFIQLGIINCLNLYVEEADNNWSVGQPTKWDVEFDADKYRCTILFNHPEKAALDTVPNFCYEIQIDSRLTLFQLKSRIADILAIDFDNFIMKRGSRFTAELKDLTLPIRDNGILGRGTLYLSMGKPSVAGEYKIKLAMGGLSKQKTDSIDFDMEELAEVVILNQWTVLQLKEHLAKELAEKFKIEVDVKKMRLREKVNLKLGRVFHNKVELKQYRIYDRIPMVVEQLSHEESTEQGDLLLYVKLFNILDYDLSPAEEVFIQQTTTFKELGEILAQRFNIDKEHIDACKINNIYSFTIDDLVLTQYDWLMLNTTQYAFGGQPWFIQKDSNLIIIRDQRTIPEDVTLYKEKATDSKQKKAGLPRITLAPIQTTKIQPPKEKALKITVVKKEIKEEVEVVQETAQDDQFKQPPVVIDEESH